MKIQIIACGQAGMKATITAIKSEVISQSQCLFINSTMNDIPNEYRSNSFIFDEEGMGCAKSRERAQKLIINSFERGHIKETINQFLDPSADTIVLVSSTDGGSGSGSVPVIADYLYTQCSRRVHVIGLDGFDTDTIGLKNRVDFLKQLDPNYVIEVICNTKFLSEVYGDHIKAEELANKEFANRISVLQGLMICESDHNIDEADLLNLCTTRGFMNIEYVELSNRIKNVQEFNTKLQEICDNTKSFDVISPTQKKMAVILNLNSTDTSSIDWEFDILKKRFGMVTNVYVHLQHVATKEFICVINAGMNMPVEAIDNIFNKYKEEKAKVNRTPDSFWGNDYDTDEDDDLFGNNVQKKSSFFSNSESGFKKTQKKVKVISNEESDTIDNY